MRIRLKTLIICSCAAMLAVSMVFFLSQNMLMQRAQNAESEYAKVEISRVQMGLSYEFFRLNTAVADWANWDDTYQFIEDNNTNYLQTNLVPQALASLNLNLMLFVNANGTIIMQKAYNLTAMTEMTFDSSQIMTKYSALLQHEDENNRTEGIVQVQEGPMLVTSAQILTSEYQGPSRGTLIFGRFLDDEEIAHLSQIVKLPINLNRIDDPNMDASFLWANNSLSPQSTAVTKPINSSFIAGYSLIMDLNEKPVYLMQVTVPRVEYAQAQTGMLYLGVSAGLTGVILIVLISLLLDRFVLSRLAKLSSNVKQLSLKDGQLIQFKFQGTDEISSLAGKINEMVTVINESQASLKDYSANLEQKVDEKTKELVETQKRLVQAERLSVIGQMAAIVGHDLRNPLFGIKTAMHILRKSASNQLDENGRKILDLVDKDIESANKILNDLLDYSREVKLGKEDRNLDELIADSLLSSRVPDRVRVKNSIDKSLEVNVDPDKIKRVFVNLIGNAVDAMPDGGALTIQSTLTGRNVEVSFSDTGTGIAPENIDKLWKPLFTTKTKGIGLGLVISKRFVEAHGGSIAVMSEKGKGTSFTIILPAFRENNQK